MFFSEITHISLQYFWTFTEKNKNCEVQLSFLFAMSKKSTFFVIRNNYT